MFDVIAHADWSTNANKRWYCVATLCNATGAFCVGAPQPVGNVSDYVKRLGHLSPDGSVLLGVDFPLGLPLAYARRAGIDDFVASLATFGSGRWDHFFELCDRPADIAIQRPFFPRRPGGTRHAQLCAGLGVSNIDELRRRCERQTALRSAASPLFWTLGGQQVGRAAISGWRDLLQPALRDSSLDVRLWPFEGNLSDLGSENRTVVAETYPAESGLHLGLPATGRGWSKRRQADRRAQATPLLRWANRRKVRLSDELHAQVQDGFGASANGEDRFDTTVGTFGLLEVALEHRLEAPELTNETRRIEGWIMGQA